ncbi:hypothetical protein F2Q69_00024999 [Brassica cretica]|uniref:Uncharacterized protein n=1 Tax=Brassica cretica TaxID=69181 RepID=A0A8S9QM64_BRACR|nr:hypothetical protein F2Q69_00024999 [Brassica cretica]
MPSDEDLSHAGMSQESLETFILRHRLRFPNKTLVPCSIPDKMFTITKSGSGKSTVDVGTADDLIPPYDALKIDALSEQEQDEEDRIGDADMNDIPVGNELMIMEEDDFLREELNQTENQEPFEQDISQPVFASEHGNRLRF